MSVQGNTTKIPSRENTTGSGGPFKAMNALQKIVVSVAYVSNTVNHQVLTWSFRFSVHNPTQSENNSSLILLHNLKKDK